MTKGFTKGDVIPAGTVKPVLSGHSKKTQKYVFKTDNRLMKVKGIAECSTPLEYSAVLLICTKLPHDFNTFVLSIFEWQLKAGFTALTSFCHALT